MLTREQLIDALREGRQEQLMHDHDWDVSDVMEVLDKLAVTDYRLQDILGEL